MARSEALKIAQKRYRETHVERTREVTRKCSRTFYALHKDELNAKRREKYRLRRDSEKISYA